MELPYVEIDLYQGEPGTVSRAVLEDSVDSAASRVARLARRTVRDASDVTLAHLAADAGPVLRSKLSAVDHQIDEETATLSSLALSFEDENPMDGSAADEESYPGDILDAAKDTAWRAVAYSALAEIVAGWDSEGEFDTKALYEVADGDRARKRLCGPTGLPEDLAGEVLWLTIGAILEGETLTRPRPYLGRGKLSGLMSTRSSLQIHGASALLFVDAHGALVEETDMRIWLRGRGRIVALTPAIVERDGGGSTEITFLKHPNAKVAIEGDISFPTENDEMAITVQGKSSLQLSGPAPLSAFPGVSGNRAAFFGAYS